MQTRRNRQGDSNKVCRKSRIAIRRDTSAQNRRLSPSLQADLAAAEFILAHHFSVVGLMEEFEESVKRITKILTGKEIPTEILNSPEIHAHDSTQLKQTKSYVYRENLDEQALNKASLTTSCPKHFAAGISRRFMLSPFSLR